jgi:hypothetical protein
LSAVFAHAIEQLEATVGRRRLLEINNNPSLNLDLPIDRHALLHSSKPKAPVRNAPSL